MEPVEQILAAFQPKKKPLDKESETIFLLTDRSLGVVDHQSTETDQKRRLQAQHKFGPSVLLDSQTGNHTEIFVDIYVFSPRHHQSTKARRKPKTLKCIFRTLL